MEFIRKYFEDLSFEEGVLLFTAFVFAVFLRFYDLGAQQPWTDELASWFYLRNLGQVFQYESQSPLYYFLLRLFLGENADVLSIRMFSGCISILNLVLIYLLARNIFDKGKATAIVIFIVFCPADIVHSRMGRHYSLLLEGSLIFLLLMKGQVRTWILSVFAFLMGFIHVFFLIPMTIVLGFDFYRQRNIKRVATIFFSSLGILIYYFVRFLVYGKDYVGGNLVWNKATFGNFINLVVAQFFGESYPRSYFFPFDIYLSWSILILMLGYLLYRRKESAFLFLAVLCGSLLFIEFSNLVWINFRINRYVIYLSAFLIFAFVDSLTKVRLRESLLIYFFSILLLIPLKPFGLYPWDDDTVASWKQVSSQNPDISRVICVNRFQSGYYELNSPESCFDNMAKIDIKKPLLFFDLNNNDRAVAAYLLSQMRPVWIKNFDHSRIIRFEPK
jgi:uncharacterized membrane protein